MSMTTEDTETERDVNAYYDSDKCLMPLCQQLHTYTRTPDCKITSKMPSIPRTSKTSLPDAK